MILTAILMYLVWAAVIVLIIYAVYRMLSALLEKYLAVKKDHASALREQSDALKEIAETIRESNDKSGTPQAII